MQRTQWKPSAMQRVLQEEKFRADVCKVRYTLRVKLDLAENGSEEYIAMKK